MAHDAVIERWPVARRGGRARYALGVAVLAAVYYGAAQIGVELNFVGPVAAIVWPPVGVGIAFLYLRGLSYWPGVLAGDLLANDYSALPLSSEAGQTFGNVLEVLVAVVLIRRLVPGGAPSMSDRRRSGCSASSSSPGRRTTPASFSRRGPGHRSTRIT